MLPPRASAADRVDPRVSERSRGRRKTTAGLAVGGFSGETNGAYGFASPKRTKGNPLLQLTTQLEGVVTSMAAHSHGRAGSGEATASWP